MMKKTGIRLETNEVIHKLEEARIEIFGKEQGNNSLLQDFIIQT